MKKDKDELKKIKIKYIPSRPPIVSGYSSINPPEDHQSLENFFLDDVLELVQERALHNLHPTED